MIEGLAFVNLAVVDVQRREGEPGRARPRKGETHGMHVLFSRHQLEDGKTHPVAAREFSPEFGINPEPRVRAVEIRQGRHIGRRERPHRNHFKFGRPAGR
jgi:hypothetical protein